MRRGDDVFSNKGDHGLESLDAPPPLTPAWAEPEYGSGDELMAANAFFESWQPHIFESSEFRPFRPSSISVPLGPSRHMLEELFKTWKPHTLESSEVLASSSSAPSPASPSANRDPLIMVEPSGPSAATQVQGS